MDPGAACRGRRPGRRPGGLRGPPRLGPAGHTATRDETLAALASTVRADHAPRLVVLGDLNTATTDRVFGPLTRLLRDAQADAGQGFGFTWPAELPVTRPDHVLYRGLTPTAAGVLHTPDSDHRAVTAGFRW